MKQKQIPQLAPQAVLGAHVEEVLAEKRARAHMAMDEELDRRVAAALAAAIEAVVTPVPAEVLVPAPVEVPAPDLPGLRSVPPAGGWTDKSVKTCPHCGHKGPLLKDFGWRTVRNGRTSKKLPQPWCRKCRSESKSTGQRKERR